MKNRPLVFLVAALGCFIFSGVEAEDAAAQRDAAAPPRIEVAAPGYGAEVEGKVEIAVRAPGFAHVEARCWKQGGQYGADAPVGSVALDAGGAGKVVFPADEYPHGPVVVRITGKAGGSTDTCYLMLYNKGGVRWNEGIPAAAPPAAQGMELVFADDFDKPPRITRTGQGGTYSSHKPGGGDFGMLHFSDLESPENPFAQTGSWLRIRADAAQKTAGLISSLRLDGSGATAAAPCYFECRFLAQNAPGTWPAFWIMSRNAYKGMGQVVDELDIIEGYGGEGAKQPNNEGYMVTSHFWNQPAQKENKNGIYRKIPVTSLGGKSSIWATFHTYGCKITREETIYYCDDIEVGRHPTGAVSAKEPFFFFINLAVGGNGWPVDLSRYGGVADMYVDYVRVYQGK